MRTIEQWLKKAKEDERCWADAAIRNYNPKFAETQVVDTLSDALNSAFDWQDSPEEEDFWDKIYKDLVNEESFDANDTVSGLITKYENTKTKLDTLQPDTSLSEPFRQAAFKVYKNSYTNDLEDLAQQIAERIGFWDKYNSLQKELETCKKTSEEVHNLYISEAKKNFESINTIGRLEKELNSITQEYEEYRAKSEEELEKYRNEYNKHVLKIDQLEQQFYVLSQVNAMMQELWLVG